MADEDRLYDPSEIGEPLFDEKDIGEPIKTAPPPEQPKTFLGHMKATVTDIPHEIYEAGAAAGQSFLDRFNPYSEANARRAEELRGRKPWDIVGSAGDVLETGKAALGAPGFVLAPITGTGRSVLGHAQAAVTPGLSYEKAKEQADLAMMGLAAGKAGSMGNVLRPPTAPTAPSQPPFGVTLSEGQQTGNLSAIQREQAALRGTSGEPAQLRAQAFADQQKAQLEAAREGVSRALDEVQPGTTVFTTNPAQQGAVLAEGPQQAGALVSEGVQQARNAQKAAVDA